MTEVENYLNHIDEGLEILIKVQIDTLNLLQVMSANQEETMNYMKWVGENVRSIALQHMP